jgi:type I restriction-modification system DNA methylase subunit
MAKKAKKAQVQSLETILWNCRNALRGTVGGNEKNRDAVMGLVFLKFAGDKFEKRRAEIKAKHGDIPAFLEKDSFYRSASVYYINETARWSYIVTNASKNDIAVILDKAMADIEDRNPPLKGALPQNFYVTLGTRKEQIKGLIDEINKIDKSHFQEKDLIGRVYEYFLQVFAIDAGQSAEKGEFFTPAGIVQDLRRWNENVYEKKYVQFTEAQIAQVKKIYNNWQAGKGYKNKLELCKSANLDEIRKQNYSLAPSKYIEFIDHDLEIDYETEKARIQAEMREIMKAEKESQKMLKAAFKGIGYGIE